jgi:hypothetical protein
MIGSIAEVAALIAVIVSAAAVRSRLVLVPMIRLWSASGWRMILLSAVPVFVSVLGKRWDTDYQQRR